MIGESGFDPSTGICWLFHHKGESGLAWEQQHERSCPVCSAKFEERQFTTFGRCRSGHRWFWAVSKYYLTREEEVLSGFEGTEEKALAAVRHAVGELKTERLLRAIFSARVASDELKRINGEKRRQRPPADGSEARPVEYLYARETCWSDGYRCECADLTGEEKVLYHINKFQIIRKTRQRIYFSKKPERVREPLPLLVDTTECGTGYVDRQKIETEGDIYSHSAHWSADFFHLYLSLEGLLAAHLRRDEGATPDLSELKAAMAAAHPDRGGSDEAFIAARARYVAVRRAVRRQTA
jgi:hypothetical protein